MANAATVVGFEWLGSFVWDLGATNRRHWPETVPQRSGTSVLCCGNAQGKFEYADPVVNIAIVRAQGGNGFGAFGSQQVIAIADVERLYSEICKSQL